jgi:CheY-like chemotaxis protein
MALILVVEDEYLIAMQTASIVEDAGHTVIGPEASGTAHARCLPTKRSTLPC